MLKFIIFLQFLNLIISLKINNKINLDLYKKIYLGGDFQTSNQKSILQFNEKLNKIEPFDTSLNGLQGVDGLISSIKRYKNFLYIGGKFTSINGEEGKNYFFKFKIKRI
jgi:hypothetical protein